MSPPAPASRQEGPRAGGLPSLSRSPIHLLSALVTVSVDKLWDSMLLDMAKTLPFEQKAHFLLIVALLLFVVTTLSTTLTQSRVDSDSPGVALAKGLAMGVLASLPYTFSATEMDLLFIGWSGINELQQRHRKTRQDPKPDHRFSPTQQENVPWTP
ncbi:hypothetical protein [Paraburkholderia tropica]|uniref:hypothetical protein n=1 Tax=Paraburkholderia tropica TaxID=92647 RepID=UPI0007EDE3B3|nr:hypothetical protein [Paraburkholderia tropica]MBB2978619.1 hypothetical protein [Paraburkholderia tropica]OBR49741.1 hypothetical protein A6456_28175 [Paraburkholderia tropica]